jgi:hypothetical protein
MRLGRGGIAFELERAAQSHNLVRIDGWNVECRAKTRLIVARGRARTYSEAVRNGRDRAERAMDLWSVKGIEDLRLSEPTTEHVAWWRSSRHHIIRIVSNSHLTLGFNMNVTVKDASGKVVRSRPPSPEWNESFRFFRLSQTTTDLFDAYRNAYLALEAILSQVVAQKVRTTGVPAESERDWFTRALRASGIPLAMYAPARVPDPAIHLFDEIYIGSRVRVFHAKAGRPTLLPQEEVNRRTVVAALRKTRDVYLAVVEATTNVGRRQRSSLFRGAFREMVERVYRDMRIAVSPDRSPADEDVPVVSPAGDPYVILPNIAPIAWGPGNSFRASRLAWADAKDLVAIPHIGRATSINDVGQALQSTILYGDLVFDTTDRLEVQLGLELSMGQQLRDRYA